MILMITTVMGRVVVVVVVCRWVVVYGSRLTKTCGRGEMEIDIGLLGGGNLLICVLLSFVFFIPNHAMLWDNKTKTKQIHNDVDSADDDYDDDDTTSRCYM